MKPLIIVMLCVQAAIVCATVFAVLFRKPTATRPVPVWSSLAISLMAVASASLMIADRHEGGLGADTVLLGGAAIFGLAIGMALMAIRARMSPPTPNSSAAGARGPGRL